jgi:hypothetical protein
MGRQKRVKLFLSQHVGETAETIETIETIVLENHQKEEILEPNIPIIDMMIGTGTCVTEVGTVETVVANVCMKSNEM